MKKIINVFFLILIFCSVFCAAETKSESNSNGLKTLRLGEVLTDFSERNNIPILVHSEVDASIHLLGITMKDVDLTKIHTMLNLYELAMTKIDGVYIVAPMRVIRQQSLNLAEDKSEVDSASEMITTVVEVKHVPAHQMVPILRPLIPQQGYMSAYMPSNKLIMTTSAHNTEQLLKIISSLDTKSDVSFPAPSQSTKNQ